MKEKKHSFHFTCYWRLEGTCVMSNKVRTWWTGSNGSPCEKWRDLILEIKGSERKTEWCCYMCWSGILDCKRHKPHSNKLKPKKERHWLTQLKILFSVYTSSVMVRSSKGICNLSLSLSPGPALFCAGHFCTCLDFEISWDDLDHMLWLARPGSCVHPHFQIKAAVTYEFFECPHLDPAIQGSSFHQRISPSQIDQGRMEVVGDSYIPWTHLYH